jgi:hypothetical protein
MAAAIELAREGYRPPRTVDGLMLNAILVYDRLHAWHALRRFPSSRNDSLEADVFWCWPGMVYDDSHGVPVLGLGYDHLTPRSRAGRPKK